MTPRASTGMCEFGSPDLFDGDDDQKRSEQHGQLHCKRQDDESTENLSKQYFIKSEIHPMDMWYEHPKHPLT